MRNPFPDNPVFKNFLGLKNSFRKYSTVEAKRRTREIAKIARIIYDSGTELAFDLVGSVNFGIADEKSDVDMIIYLDCGNEEEADYQNCPSLKFFERLVLTSLLREISNRPYKMEVVDAINLRRLKKKIEMEDFTDDIIYRFVFYRTICRGVNKRILRPYERSLMSNKFLFSLIEERLTEVLIEFTKTSTHRRSFGKYISRLKENEVKLPPSILMKVKDYLDSQ